MSADDERFEAQVREALHEETPELPVRITAAEVRARAGIRRSRWSLLMNVRSVITALAPVTVVVLVALLVFGPPFGSSAPTPPTASGVVPPLTTRSPTAAATPVASPPPTRLPLATPLPLGDAGDWLLVAVEEGVVRVTAVGSDGERVLSEGGAPLFFQPTGERVAASVNGHVAIEVDADGTLGTWVIDLRDPRDPGRLVPGGRPSFGPLGDLVTSQESGALRRHFLVEGGFTAEITPSVDVPFPAVFAADGSGLFATRGAEAEPVTLTWEGAVVDRDPAAAPWFATGIERTASAAGEPLRDVLPVVAGVADVSGAVLDRSGRTVVVTSPDGEGSAIHAGAADDPRAVRTLATLPGRDVRITGMTEDAVIVTLASGESVAVALDGSGIVGERHQGEPALIVP